MCNHARARIYSKPGSFVVECDCGLLVLTDEAFETFRAGLDDPTKPLAVHIVEKGHEATRELRRRHEKKSPAE